LMKMKTPSGKLARWTLSLQEFQNFMKIEHRKGSKQQHIDALSRIEMNAINNTPNSDEQDVLAIEDIVEAQSKDERINKIKAYLESFDTDAEENIIKESSAYEIVNGLLYQKVYRPKNQVDLRIEIPETLRDRALRECHNHVIAGHGGLKRTYSRLIEKYY
jgi:hypothetical protein